MPLDKPFVATNHLEKELGDITPEQLEQVTEILSTFMTRLREIQARAPSSLETPCATCAMNPRTDVLRGFAPTAYGVLKSLRDRTPFLCHGNQPEWKDNVIDPKDLRTCRGFIAVALTNPVEAVRIVYETMEAIRQVVPM